MLINGIVKKVEEANCFFPIIDFVDVCLPVFLVISIESLGRGGVFSEPF